MPRLNHGRLLENLVVLEVARVLTRSPEVTVEFACSFAMPPLTQCWHRTQQEPVNNPRFNAGVRANLLNGTFAVGAPTSYSALLRDCIANAPNLPVVPYALTDATQLCEYVGPNGALLTEPRPSPPSPVPNTSKPVDAPPRDGLLRRLWRRLFG